MRLAWALLPLVASSGCLFLDPLNHAPTVTIRDGVTTTNKGATLSIQADAADAEDGVRGVTLTYAVSDAADGQPLVPPCDFDGSAFGALYQVTFYRTGIFDIKVVATDSDGASSEAHVMVTITDAKPYFSDKASIVQTSTRDACGLNAAGAQLTLQLDGDAIDPDAGARGSGSCPDGETLSYRWRVTDWPAGDAPLLTLFDGVNCAPATAASGTALDVPSAKSQVCLWTDPQLVAATGMYSVVLDVSDGTSVVTSPVGDVPVGPDQPPCITGTEPIAGSYVVDRTALQHFFVDGVADDLDRFGGDGIHYAWSVYRAADQSWREVPSWDLSTYDLDVSSFGVGERLRVRVEVFDRTRAPAPASCLVAAADCQVASCAAAPNVCNKWKTWDLELR